MHLWGLGGLTSITKRWSNNIQNTHTSTAERLEEVARCTPLLRYVVHSCSSLLSGLLLPFTRSTKIKMTGLHCIGQEQQARPTDRPSEHDARQICLESELAAGNIDVADQLEALEPRPLPRQARGKPRATSCRARGVEENLRATSCPGRAQQQGGEPERQSRSHYLPLPTTSRTHNLGVTTSHYPPLHALTISALLPHTTEYFTLSQSRSHYLPLPTSYPLPPALPLAPTRSRCLQLPATHTQRPTTRISSHLEQI